MLNSEHQMLKLGSVFVSLIAGGCSIKSPNFSESLKKKNLKRYLFLLEHSEVFLFYCWLMLEQRDSLHCDTIL